MKIKKLKLKIDSRGFLRLTKRGLVMMLIALIVFTGSGLYIMFSPKTVQAAWYDDNWAYRQAVTVTVSSSSSDISNLETLLTIDTTGITSKLQSSCQDLRFTNTSGQLLPYYIDTCSNNSATNKVWVLADLVPKNTTTYTLYMYYGNPSAPAASDSTKFRLFNGLVGYWTMNESSWTNNCSASTVIDSSVKGNNGKSCPNTTGPTGGATGQYGNAGGFDGSNDYLSITQASSINNMGSAMSAGGWFYFNSIPDPSVDSTNLIDKRNAANSQISYLLQVSPPSRTTGQIRFTAGSSNTGSPAYDGNQIIILSSTSTGIVTTGKWYHIFAVYDGASSKIYLNGVNVTSSVSGTYGSLPNLSDNNLILGAHGTNLNQLLNGSMDDIRIYNRALSASEVTQLYNNPGTIASTATATSAPTTSFATEEKAPQPAAYWKFDDGGGTTAKDSTTNSNNGTLSGTTLPTWQTEDQCIAGKCLYFDGSTSYVIATSNTTIPTATPYTISAWVRPNLFNSIETIISKWNGVGSGNGFDLRFNSGKAELTVCVTSCDTATGSTTLTANKWYYITAVYTSSAITVYVNGLQDGTAASNNRTTTNNGSTQTTIGNTNATTGRNFPGFIDEVKIYPYARTATQVQTDYNARGNAIGAGAVLGADTTNQNLSNGLVGYWKMDESSGNAADSSGNGTTLTNNNTTTFAAGKFGNGSSFNGTTQYFSTASTISGVQTVSFWVYPASTTNNYVNLTSSAYITSTSGTVSATGFTSPSIYVNGTLNGTITASAWNHVAITTGTAISANQVEAGRANSSYLSNTSKLDEARIYNRALSSVEVSQLYNWAPGPKVYLNMEEGSGTAANDTSGNANNGTVNTGTWTTGKYGKGVNVNGTAGSDVSVPDFSY